MRPGWLTASSVLVSSSMFLPWKLYLPSLLPHLYTFLVCAELAQAVCLALHIYLAWTSEAETWILLVFLFLLIKNWILEFWKKKPNTFQLGSERQFILEVAVFWQRLLLVPIWKSSSFYHWYTNWCPWHEFLIWVSFQYMFGLLVYFIRALSTPFLCTVGIVCEWILPWIENVCLRALSRRHQQWYTPFAIQHFCTPQRNQCQNPVLPVFSGGCWPFSLFALLSETQGGF